MADHWEIGTVAEACRVSIRSADRPGFKSIHNIARLTIETENLVAEWLLPAGHIAALRDCCEALLRPAQSGEVIGLPANEEARR